MNALMWNWLTNKPFSPNNILSGMPNEHIDAELVALKTIYDKHRNVSTSNRMAYVVVGSLALRKTFRLLHTHTAKNIIAIYRR